MSDPIDKEVEAIGTVLRALQPLDASARASVLDYVSRRLEVAATPLSQTTLPDALSATLERAPDTSSTRTLHIDELVAEKKPQSAIEMAVLVAYYLSNSAPENERKETINTKDVETYFKIGGYRLPTKPQFTLPNTKNAGYLDALGNGEYRLNPVGYNLVVHSMPTSSAKPKIGKRPRKKATTKKGDSKSQK